MKTTFFFLLAFPLLYAGCQSSIHELSPEDIQEIHRVEQAFVKANIAGDIDGMLALRTNDVVWMPPGSPAVEGKTALRQFLSTSPIRTIDFSVSPLRTEGRNGLAYNRGNYTMMYVMGDDTLNDNGKYAQVWRKQPNNSWLLALEVWNTNTSPQP